MEWESFSRLPVFQAPICLISNSEDGKLQVEPEPLKQIQQIDVPLVVVAIAGLYRTGKSYLLNRLAGSSSGFPLGKTIESKTKGIWVWCREHPEKPSTVLLLLDTEGLGDVAKGDSGHDNRIFTVVTLLSSVLVYNMMSVFNQDAVEKLTFISEISKNIRFSNAKDGDVGDEELGLILPTFVLCLRDFTLVLEIDGMEITVDEYLEDCLKLKSGNDSSVTKYNMPRECIRKYFPRRKCFVFDRPGDRKTMKSLESVPLEKLAESFVEDTKLFLEYIYTCSPKVLISSKEVNGRMFVSLVESYLNAIRNGAVPDVDDAIIVVANIENERLASEAVQIFEQKIELIQLPILHFNNFEELYRDMQKAALANFRIETLFNAERFEKQAMSEMDELWERIKKKNLQLVRNHCESLLVALYDKNIGEKMKRNEYKVTGGYPLYKLDMDAMKNDYVVKVKDIDRYEAQEVLMSFLDREAENERNIMLEDQKMTEEDKKRELERLHEEHLKAQASQQTLFESKLMEEKERAEEHQRKMEEERKEYMIKQDENMAAIKRQWDVQKEISEKQIQMMCAENEAQRKSFQEQISKLTEQHQKKEQENKTWFENLIQSENKKAQQRIDDVTQNFQNMLEVEKKMCSNMEQNLQMQKQALQEEKESRQQMEQEYLGKMEKYQRQIDELINKSERDDKMNAELMRLINRRDEYRRQASRRKCHIM
ncbi:guanylate-binding protein 1-like isoform X2 [Mercenaria mercenaria]|uniref:guanylate-binding protein 1-like isoform X2 n=1 Tax=Mercenaria mercenaria TaxID=6596 RepID=UPI00234FA1FA|nr:guanylate-binding protein 1-like isoform X2 [Mercenaria mercenaria]